MTISDTNGPHVAYSFEVNQWLLWSKSDSTWAWQLTPTTDTNGTRLLTRIHAVYAWRHPITALFASTPPGAPVRLLAFVDESMRRVEEDTVCYFLAAAVIPEDNCPHVRDALKALVPGRQGKLHWRDEAHTASARTHHQDDPRVRGEVTGGCGRDGETPRNRNLRAGGC